MKQTGRCPRCSSTDLGHLSAVVDQDERGAWDRPHVRQIAAVGGRGFLGRGWELVARTEAYVCLGCGYFEEYVVDPDRVPWDEVDGFRRLKNAPE